MSWDGYTDNLVKSGFSEACIFGLDDQGVWAQANMTLTPEEIKAILDGFKNPGLLQANGLRIDSKKYFFLQADESQIQCKLGKGGVTIVKGGKCVIVGVYGDSLVPGQARIVVEKMREYLAGSGF